MESSPEQAADLNSTRHVVTFYSSTADEVEQHFARALSRVGSQSPRCAEAEPSSLGEFRRVQESCDWHYAVDYGNANGVNRFGVGPIAYPQFIPFILEPDIDVTREVIRFPEEVEDDIFSFSSARIILLDSQPHAAGAESEALTLHHDSCPESLPLCGELSNSCRPHHEGLLDPLGLLSDAEILGVLMNC